MMHIDLIGFVTIFAMLLSMNQFKLETKLYRKIILLICFLGMVVATYFTMSRGSFLALFIAFIIFFLKRHNLLVIFFIIFSLITVITVPSLKARFSRRVILSDLRIGTYLRTLEIIKDYPIFGIGFGMQTYGNKKFINLKKYDSKIPNRYQMAEPIIGSPHNSLADVAVRTGLIGFSLFCWVYFIFFRLGWNIIRFGKDDFIRDWGICIMAAFISVVIQGLFADGMFGPQAIVLYTLFAFMDILRQLNAQTDHILIRN
jgi:O-antigen ligase